MQNHVKFPHIGTWPQRGGFSGVALIFIITGCTQIANCAIHQCSTAYNQRCVTCDNEYTHQVRAYKPVTSNGYPERVCERKFYSKSYMF